MSYVDIVICIGPLPILETWPPIYRGQERTVRDGLKASQVYSYVYFRYTPCLTDLTFKFIRRPTPPILSPSSRTFVELTLVTLELPQLFARRCSISFLSKRAQVLVAILHSSRECLHESVGEWHSGQENASSIFRLCNVVPVGKDL
jgi:hypothetical protein